MLQTLGPDGLSALFACLSAGVSVIHDNALCSTAQTNAGDDRQDAGPDAEAGRWRG